MNNEIKIVHNRIITFLLCVLFTCHLHSQVHQPFPGKNPPVFIRSLMDLGGEKQYVEITGESENAPVILFVHGGPGWPQTPQLRYFNNALTKSFILATWDQRGSGLSYQQNPSPGNMTLAQIVEDAHQLTRYLQKKFHKKKIILAGYSWGSIVGIELALRYPQDYSAYVGIAQVINIKSGMAVTREWLIGKAQAKGDTNTLKMITLLQMGDTALCKTDLDCLMTQYGLLGPYNGATFNPEAEKESEKAIRLAPDYIHYDWLKGFTYSASHLAKDMFAADMRSVDQLALPVYLFLGRHDWNVPSVLAVAFFEKLKAPHKEIIWFEQSGHGISEEEPAFFNEVFAQKLLQ